MQCCVCLGRLYYRAIKDILPSDELLVYYGDDYATELGIDTAAFTGSRDNLEFLTEEDDKS